MANQKWQGIIIRDDPEGPVNVGNYILLVHDYNPSAFVSFLLERDSSSLLMTCIDSTSWGRTFWGTDADRSEVEDSFIDPPNHPPS